MNLITARGLRKVYQPGRLAVEALRGVDLDIPPGAFVVLLGPSGGGKTTLLNLLGGVSRLTGGSLVVGGLDLAQASPAQSAAFRRAKVGFVLQFFNLLPSQNALDNVALALLARGYAWEAARQEARQMLDRLGLSSGTEPGRLRHRPAELSGGEQQRVAIARAVVGQPSLLLADEPTGNLDSENAAEIMRLLASLRQDLNLTCVLATHNPEFRQVATQVIELRDGLVQCDISDGDYDVEQLTPAQKEMMDLMLEMIDMTPIITNPEYVRAEPFNGVPSNYFTFQISGMGSQSGAEIVSNQGEYWLAVDGNYIMKYNLRLETRDEDGSLMRFVVRIEMLSVNQPVTIVMPEGCVGGE